MEKSPHEKRLEMIAAERHNDGSRRDILRLAELAYGELGMAGTLHSRADQVRLERLYRGLVCLDEEQAKIKDEILELEQEYEKKKDVAALLAGLKRIREKVPPKTLGRPKKAP